MKILVFADFHGSMRAISDAVDISREENPDKTVVCGDLFGWSSPSEIARTAEQFHGILYFVKGNNDWGTAVNCLNIQMEDSVIMYAFGRTLFFTHGDRYNPSRIPPFLKKGDALVYGHTHVGDLRVRDGLYTLNVGSLARPRDGTPSYLVLDESGASLRQPDGRELYRLDWN